MKLAASITKFKNKDNFIGWLEFLPKKYDVKNINKLLKILREGTFVLWTESKGIKILK